MKAVCKFGHGLRRKPRKRPINVVGLPLRNRKCRPVCREMLSYVSYTDAALLLVCCV